MDQSPFLRVRLALLYVTTSVAAAVTTPFWSVYLQTKGLDGQAIGFVLAATYFARPLFSPLAGMLADRRGDYRVPMIAIGIASVATTALYGPAHGLVALLLISLLASGCSSALGPLMESLTLLCGSRFDFQYGHIRLWGSVSFIVATTLFGWSMVGSHDSALFPTSLAAMAVVAFACWLAPDIRREVPAQGPPPLKALICNRSFMLLIGIASLNQASHIVYYNYSSLHWQAAGLSGGLIGLLWSEGVIAEVLVFAFGAQLERRLGPVRLMAIGGLGGVVRWSILANTTNPILLAMIQWTHGMTFAASHLGAMYFIARAVPLAYSARAQGIYQSVSLGFVFALASPVAGWLFVRFGGDAFLGCAILSAGGYVGTLILRRWWQGGSILPTSLEETAISSTAT